MTIQAYQTLYESSIAYGMRKALQAEQNKAQILIQIQNVEAEIDDLEGDVDDLKKKINKLLHDCRRQKDASKDSHQSHIRVLVNDNKNTLKGVKDILTTFEEAKRDDDWMLCTWTRSVL